MPCSLYICSCSCDPTWQANGADPNEVAVNTLDNVAKGKADFVLAASFSSQVAIWLRLLFPSVLQKLLVKRFDKAKEIKDKND
mmetsp:Transcript_39595/g.95705  ORF Transcript_39595/g.95705 Transcript_39595/m.95705 type:complete len:83 (+) Transcript_39595:55-303(+)